MILDVDKIYASLLAAGEDWSDKQAAATLLEETKKSVLSNIIISIELKELNSIAAKEAFALAHPDYKLHLERMVEAGRLRDRAKVRYESLKMLAELRRSQESTKRAELSTLRG